MNQVLSFSPESLTLISYFNNQPIWVYTLIFINYNWFWDKELSFGILQVVHTLIQTVPLSKSNSRSKNFEVPPSYYLFLIQYYPNVHPLATRMQIFTYWMNKIPFEGRKLFPSIHCHLPSFTIHLLAPVNEGGWNHL